VRSSRLWRLTPTPLCKIQATDLHQWLTFEMYVPTSCTILATIWAEIISWVTSCIRRRPPAVVVEWTRATVAFHPQLWLKVIALRGRFRQFRPIVTYNFSNASVLNFYCLYSILKNSNAQEALQYIPPLNFSVLAYQWSDFLPRRNFGVRARNAWLAYSRPAHQRIKRRIHHQGVPLSFSCIKF